MTKMGFSISLRPLAASMRSSRPLFFGVVIFRLLSLLFVLVGVPQLPSHAQGHFPNTLLALCRYVRSVSCKVHGPIGRHGPPPPSGDKFAMILEGIEATEGPWELGVDSKYSSASPLAIRLS